MKQGRVSRRALETVHLANLIKNKRVGWRAFVARPNTGAGANRSVALVGCEASGWIQGIKCWHDDHRARAQAYAERYNRAPGK